MGTVFRKHPFLRAIKSRRPLHEFQIVSYKKKKLGAMDKATLKMLRAVVPKKSRKDIQILDIYLRARRR